MIFGEPNFSKNLQNSLKFLNFIEKDNIFSICNTSDLLDNKILKSSKGVDQIDIEIETDQFNQIPGWEINKIALYNKEYTLYPNKIYLTKKTGGEKEINRGHINFISTSNFDDDVKYFTRLIIPIEEQNFFYNTIEAKYTLECKYLKNSTPKSWINYRCLIPLNIGDVNYHFYIIGIEKNSYLIIESLGKVNYKVFHNSIKSILFTFGFFTGKLIMDQGYFTFSFSEDFNTEELFMYRTLYKKRMDGICIINTNNHAFATSLVLEENDLMVKMNALTCEEFSRICNLLFFNENLERAIFIFLETNSQEIFLRCALFSVAIETLANIINNENPETRERFLPDEKLWIEYRTELLNIHSKFKDSILKKLTTDNDVFESGIMNLNKLGTTALLFNPFNIYKIKLCKEEEIYLNYRNRFLHGDNPFQSEKDRTDDNSTFGITYYASLRLQTMFIKLFLKYVNYSGYILNYVKLHSPVHKIEVNEPPFLKI